MIIHWEDRDWHYEPDALTVGELRTIRDHAGYGAITWEARVRDCDPDAIEALWWLVRTRNGVAAEITKPMAGNPVSFWSAYWDAAAEVAKARKKSEPAAPKAASARSGRRGSTVAPPG